MMRDDAALLEPEQGETDRLRGEGVLLDMRLSHYKGLAERHRSACTMWQAKFRLMCHEANKLRNRVRALEKRLPSEPSPKGLTGFLASIDMLLACMASDGMQEPSFVVKQARDIEGLTFDVSFIMDGRRHQCRMLVDYDELADLKADSGSEVVLQLDRELRRWLKERKADGAQEELADV